MSPCKLDVAPVRNNLWAEAKQPDFQAGCSGRPEEKHIEPLAEKQLGGLMSKILRDSETKRDELRELS